MQKDNQELWQIVSIMKYAANIHATDIKGLKDTGYKFWACYMAKRVTNYSNREIAAFFNINPVYMKTQIEHAAIGFLVDTSSKLEMERMCCLYLELKIYEN